MFRIEIFGIDASKVNTEFNTDVETLGDAENVALFQCRTLGKNNKIMLHHFGGLMYQVFVSFYCVGVVTIRSI